MWTPKMQQNTVTQQYNNRRHERSIAKFFIVLLSFTSPFLICCLFVFFNSEMSQ